MFSFFSRQKHQRKARTRLSTRHIVHESAISGWVLFLTLLLWFSVLVLVVSNDGRPHSNLATGQRAQATVVAVADFSCEDVARTELNRRQAANAVPPVFVANFGSYNAGARTLEKLFERLTQLRDTATEEGGKKQDVAPRIGEVLDLLGVPLTPAELQKLAPRGQEQRVLDIVKSVLHDAFAAGVMSAADRKAERQLADSASRVSIRSPDGSTELNTSVDDLPLPETVLESVAEKIAQKLDEPTSKPILLSLLRPWVVPNLVYDPYLTEEYRREAEKVVMPVMMKIHAGTPLVEAGERITPQIIEKLAAHDLRLAQLESPYDRAVKRIGSAGLLIAALIACIGLLQLLKPEILRQNSRILLLVVLSLLALLPAKLLLSMSGPATWLPPTVVDFALPLALAPLLASILAGSAVAIAVGLWNSFAMAVLLDNNFAVFTLGLVVTIVATLATQDVRRRSRIYRAGLFVGLAELLYAISLAAVSQLPAGVVVGQATAGFASGILCAFLATLLIPLFEMLFGITTNLTLLELADLSHPLLQRLAMEAPGSYHHSIVAANLGQAAASRIGANALLVRVASYFHDIGKLVKPDFYTENQHTRDNPHDDLAPSMSALVIKSHVKEGVALARQFKLPSCVMDAIEQHHGTGLVSFFYRRACQLQENGKTDTEVNEADYRYDGPRPRSREMAILALADAVEAAARSLEKPNPARIEALVNEVADSKLRDGQLDASGITLSELAAVKTSFIFSLANMLHVRIAYPQDEAKGNPAAGKTPGGWREGAPTDTVALDPESSGPDAVG